MISEQHFSNVVFQMLTIKQKYTNLISMLGDFSFVHFGRLFQATRTSVGRD